MLLGLLGEVRAARDLVRHRLERRLVLHQDVRRGGLGCADSGAEPSAISGSEEWKLGARGVRTEGGVGDAEDGGEGEEGEDELVHLELDVRVVGFVV